MKKSLSILAAIAIVAPLIVFGVTQEKSTGAGRVIGGTADEPLSFHGKPAIPMASAAAQATVVPSATAAISPTAIPTITPTFTPVGVSLNPIVAQINLLTAQVNQLTSDNVNNAALINRLQKDLKDKGIIKGGP